MISRDQLREFPIRRIKPEEGMAVTPEVWQAAHEFHRQRLRFHDLLRHGPGILSGLDVIASEPPDSTLYILPGMAVDPQGEVIALVEPVAYDVGPAQGLLHLILTYEESLPGEPAREGASPDEPVFVQCQFGIEALPDLPEDRGVELARLRRRERNAPLTDAQDPEHPGLNEIDLRFRVEMLGRQRLDPPGAKPGRPARLGPTVSLGVAYAGGAAPKKHGQGVDLLAHAVRQSGRRVAVDDDVPLASGLEGYALLFLVGQAAFKLGREEMISLHAYLRGGGTVLFESCRHETAGGNPPADASFAELLSAMGIELAALGLNHALLREPCLFAAPPPGYETEGTPTVLAGEGAILSTCDYGCLWQGKRRGRIASREEIRTAMEWGSNLIAYALSRRSSHEASPDRVAAPSQPEAVVSPPGPADGAVGPQGEGGPKAT